jgi:hypothetical protein
MFAPSRRMFLGASLAGLIPSHFLDAGKSGPKIAHEPPFQPSTLFLTWQRDPTTTMTVQWVGRMAETVDTTIHYAARRSDGWLDQAVTVKPYPRSELMVFRAELTGLDPGTDYHFRIGKRSPTYRFRTMPARATDTIHFISGGDCGTNSHTIANNIQAARQDPMFAVVGGDLGYDNGQSVETSLAFLRNYSKHMVGRDDRLIPMIPCIGNHEVEGGYHQPRTKAPFFYALFDGLYPETGFAALDFGDYLSLVLLDTDHTTPIAGEQTAWLEKTLKARVDHPNVFVVNHVPAYPSFRSMSGAVSLPGPLLLNRTVAKVSAGTGQGNRTHWVPLFQKYRVPVVLEHHDHTFKRTRPLLDGLAHKNGVLYLGDGSWGQLRTPKKPDQLSYLAASSRDYHLSLHRIQGEERFHLALDENGRVMDVCQSSQRTRGVLAVTS